MPQGYITKKTVIREFRRSFDAKIAPTQLFQQEKDLVLKAVEDHEYESISAFCREAIREKLERLGYEVPAEETYIKAPETA